MTFCELRKKDIISIADGRPMLQGVREHIRCG